LAQFEATWEKGYRITTKLEASKGEVVANGGKEKG